MGKKKRDKMNLADPGLTHVSRLGIKACNSENEMFSRYAKACGQDRVGEIKTLYYSKRGKEFYALKDSDYDLAMIFSGSYDADIVRNICNWIDSNRKLFGESILEIGCGCGFITTFLGSVFPDKKIVAIDRNRGAIDIARKNCEKLGVDNIEFINCDATDIKGRSFDTVLSVRTMHENGDMEEDVTEDIIPSSKKYANALKDYAETISALTSHEGVFISTERTGRNALLLGWFDALITSGFDYQSGMAITCKELGDRNTFPVLVFFKESPKKEPFDAFMEYNETQINLHLAHYNGWDAKILFAFTRGEKIADYLLSDTTNGNTLRHAVYLHRLDSSAIMVFRDENGFGSLYYYDISQKNEVISSTMSMIKQSRTGPWKIEEL